MKEFMGNSVNVSMVEMQSGTFKASAELVIVVSEPTYSISPAGEMIRQREVDHFRFSAMVRPLRALIKSLTEYADEMERMEARFPVADKSEENAA